MKHFRMKENKRNHADSANHHDYRIIDFGAE